MKLFLILLCSCLLACGQGFVRTAAFQGAAVKLVAGAPPVSPLNDVTNLANYPCTGFYLVSSGTYTTNGVPSRASLTPLVGTYSLTNLIAFGVPYRTNNANGYDSLYFNAGENLVNMGYTNTQPFEFVVVASLDGYPAGNTYLMGNYSDLNFRIGELNNKHWYMNNGSGLTGGSTSYTNKFIVLDCVFFGASSAGYTNNGVDMSGNAGTSQSGAFMVGGVNTSGTFKGWIAAIATYGNQYGTNAIPGTNETARGKVFSALTNYFGITP